MRKRLHDYKVHSFLSNLQTFTYITLHYVAEILEVHRRLIFREGRNGGLIFKSIANQSTYTNRLILKYIKQLSVIFN